MNVVATPCTYLTSRLYTPLYTSIHFSCKWAISLEGWEWGAWQTSSSGQTPNCIKLLRRYLVVVDIIQMYWFFCFILIWRETRIKSNILTKNEAASSIKHNSSSRHESKPNDLTFHGRETNNEPKASTVQTENPIVPYLTRCVSPRRNTTRSNNETNYTLPNETTELSPCQERNEWSHTSRVGQRRGREPILLYQTKLQSYLVSKK